MYRRAQTAKVLRPKPSIKVRTSPVRSKSGTVMFGVMSVNNFEALDVYLVLKGFFKDPRRGKG